MKRHVSMIYDADRDIETLSHTAGLHKKARDSVLTRYQVECGVYLMDDGILVDITQSKDHHFNFMAAVSEYIKEAGAPKFVNYGLDYKAISYPLKEQGKKLKRKALGILAGRHVVPA